MAQKQNTAHTENNTDVKSPAQRQVGKGCNTVQRKVQHLVQVELGTSRKAWRCYKFHHSNVKAECIYQTAYKTRTLAVQLEGINRNSVHQTGNHCRRE